MQSNQLLFSVVIPTYNRARQLRECLQALAAQDLPKQSFEVILVDDGGREPLEETLAPFRELLAIRLLYQKHQSCAAARQFGIEHASGEYLAFTDDDCRPSPDWLSTMASILMAHPGCAAGGFTLNGAVDNAYAEATQTVVRTLTESRRVSAGWVPYCPTSNAAFPAFALRSVGGLDPTWAIAGGEDRDLCARWSNAGRQLVYAPEARVFHFHRLTLAQFVKQHFQYGRSAMKFLRLNEARALEFRQSLRIGFYRAQFRTPFEDHPPRRAGLIFAVVILTQIATAAGMVSEACSHAGRRSVQRHPVRMNR
jgi:glycosyltransferase involved in cell wall biosynthesis